MKSTGIKLLWNTSSLFTNPRFVSGASTSPFADIYAYAGGQLKHSLEIAKRLGAENYVFWGGREGYENLWNTQMKREQEHLDKLLREGNRPGRPVPDRAEGQGTDDVPVRLRCRHRHQLPAHL